MGATRRSASGAGRKGRSFLLLAALLALLVLLAFSPVLSPAVSPALASPLSQKQQELKTAQAELAKLQDSYDELAKKAAAAEARRAQTDDAIAAAEKEIAQSEKDYAAAQARRIERLVHLYKDNHSSIPRYLEILFAESDFSGVIQRFTLLKKLADQDNELYTEIEGYMEKTRAQKTALEEKRWNQAVQTAELQALQVGLNVRMTESAAQYRTLKRQVTALKKAAAAAAAAAKAAREAAAHAREFYFPVDGPHSYADSFGDPRPGGRSHEGCDIMAPRGTPLVACVWGTVVRTNRKDTGLGGISLTIRGANGNYYLYCHLRGIAAGIKVGARVKGNQVVGWVGDTGDADPGAYHLHFEIHPGGGSPINPYRTLRAAD